MRYKVQRGRVELRARAASHDTIARFSKLDGAIDFDADAAAGARAEVVVDMQAFDGGDDFKNWKLEQGLDTDRHPTATFTLSHLQGVREEMAGRLVAAATGQIRWRGQSVDVKLKGRAQVDRRSIDAEASFELDVRRLGISPAQLVAFGVEDKVLVHVSLRAVAT